MSSSTGRLTSTRLRGAIKPRQDTGLAPIRQAWLHLLSRTADRGCRLRRRNDRYRHRDRSRRRAPEAPEMGSGLRGSRRGRYSRVPKPAWGRRDGDRSAPPGEPRTPVRLGAPRTLATRRPGRRRAESEREARNRASRRAAAPRACGPSTSASSDDAYLRCVQDKEHPVSARQ